MSSQQVPLNTNGPQQTTATSSLGGFACPVISGLYPYMHWVSRRAGNHIDALHYNIVKGRQVILAEDPELHLVWYGRTILIKPLPPCLLEQSIWKRGPAATGRADATNPDRYDAIGFIRSYAHLIKHESDFLLGQNLHLLPSNLSYSEFCQRIAPFRDVSDTQVSLRYHYGQLRLTRLNWAIRIFQPSVRREDGLLGRLYYHELYWETRALVNAFIAPYVFIFGTLSTTLTAMQLLLAAESIDRAAWDAVVLISWGFGNFVLVLIAVFLALVVLIFVLSMLAQATWSWTQRR